MVQMAQDCGSCSTLCGASLGPPRAYRNFTVETLGLGVDQSRQSGRIRAKLPLPFILIRALYRVETQRSLVAALGLRRRKRVAVLSADGLVRLSGTDHKRRLHGHLVVCTTAMWDLKVVPVTDFLSNGF